MLSYTFSFYSLSDAGSASYFLDATKDFLALLQALIALKVLGSLPLGRCSDSAYVISTTRKLHRVRYEVKKLRADAPFAVVVTVTSLGFFQIDFNNGALGYLVTNYYGH